MSYIGRALGQGVRNRFIYTATAGQTTFSGSDDNGITLVYTDGTYVDVNLNGVELVSGTDYTATSGTSIVLTTGASLNDTLSITVYDVFAVADTVSAQNGGTFSGDVNVNGDLAVDTNTLFVDASANSVGIGTSSPSRPLHVNNASESNVRIQGGSDIAELRVKDADNAFSFHFNSAERMRIDSSGNLLVGTTSVFIGSGISPKMTISKSGGSGLGINSIGSAEVGLGTRPSANHSYYAGFFLNNAGTGVGNITVGASSTAYNTSSDYRLKENVTPLNNASDRLKQIPVHRFNFIADPDTTVDGFLAHEVQAIVPEAITGAKDAVDSDGNPEYQGIDQSKLVPLLTAALQEALTKIEDLEARVTALETP